MPWSTSTDSTTATDQPGRGCASGGPGSKPDGLVRSNPAGRRAEQFEEFARTGDDRLRNELVEAHLGLAHQLARRFSSRGESYDDLVQVASLALVKSVDRFDPERGVEFSTFATRTVIGELKRHFRDKGWAIRAPRRIQELYLELGPAIEIAHPGARPSPTVAEMARADRRRRGGRAGGDWRPARATGPPRSMRPTARTGPSPSRLGDIDGGFVGTEDRMLLAISLTRLPERERTILNLRFVDGLTQSEIAERIGISQMHVSRLLAASLAKLRETFDEEG